MFLRENEEGGRIAPHLRADERVPGWADLFRQRALTVRHVETYRPKLPTLMTYPHTLFVLDR